MHIGDMILNHPHNRGTVSPAIIECVEACSDCAATCSACADACLGEATVAELIACIRLDLDCADICAATGAVAVRGTGRHEVTLGRLLEACAEACRRCGDECAKHAEMHEHCRICAAACRRCEQACRDLKKALGRVAETITA